MADLVPVLIAVLAFAAVAAVVFVAGQHMATQAQMQRRLPASVQGPSDGAIGLPPGVLQGFIAQHFTEKKFGVDSTLKGKLRRDLLRAGYFRSDALNYYIFARITVAVAVPVIAYIAAELLIDPWLPKFLFVAVAIAVAIIGSGIFLDMRRRRLAQRYRELFPDLFDLLVVCIDAGLSLEGAFDRVTGEIVKHSRPLGLNLMMMSAEMRAGRSTIDALESLADRMDMDEVRSLVLVLRQSLELGSNVGDTLRIFSDDMREKRVLRAEEKANKLPVKLSIPLGLFIFPVILLVILFPIAIRLITLMAMR